MSRMALGSYVAMTPTVGLLIVCYESNGVCLYTVELNGCVRMVVD